MGKQPRWTVLEDVASCRAYARVSLDSVVGSNQTSASLEARVGAECQRMMRMLSQVRRGQFGVLDLAVRWYVVSK
jgi:hypothetical protein